MKKLIFLFFLLLNLTLVYSQELRSFQENNLFGFKNKTTVIIQPKYQYASEFYGNLALIKNNNLWGYIDKKGIEIIKPQFHNAEIMQNGKAKVYLNNKVGLIDSLGNIIVPIEFESIEENYYGIQFRKGNKVGLLTNEGEYIDAIYTEINKSGNFIYGKEIDELGVNPVSYDIFYKGKRIYSNSEKAPTILGWNTIFTIVDIYSQGKVGIINNEGEFIAEPLYTKLDITYTNNPYPLKNSEFKESTVYVLTKSETEGDPDNIDYQSYRLLKRDGTYFSDQPFDYVATTYDDNGVETIQLKQFGKIAYIDTNGTIVSTPYTRIEKLEHGFNFKYKENNSVDIFQNGNENEILCSFNYVEIPLKYDEGYDEYGNFYETKSWNGELIVSNDSNATSESGKKALYDLYSLQYISEFLDTVPRVVSSDYYYNDLHVYFVGRDGFFNFWYKGLEPISLLPYSSINNVTNAYFELTSINGSKKLYSFETEKYFDIKNYIPESSFSIFNQAKMQSIPVFDPENPEVEYIEPESRFYSNFIHLTDTTTNKVGFLFNDFFAQPKYDSIVQVFDNELPIVYLKSGSKWGWYYKYTNTIVEPFYDNIPHFQLTQESSLYYPLAEIEENNEKYFLDIKGRKLDYYFEGAFAIKKDKKWGLESDYINAKENLDDTKIIVAPIYKALVETEESFLFTAKNNKNLVGVIDAFGDTIIPLIYSSITFSDNSYMFEEAFRALELKNGKKIGLFNTTSRKIIPAEYDKIEPVVIYSQIKGFLVHQGDKVGFYNRDFSFQIPCIYDGIAIDSKGDYGFEIALLKDNKMAFVNTYIIDKDLNALINKSVWYDHVITDYGYLSINGKWQVYDRYNGKLIKNCDQIETIQIADFTEAFVENNLIGIRGDLDAFYVKPKLMHLYMIDADVYYVFKDGFAYLQYIGSDDLILKSDW